jgi:plasmid rolling circle replication initiator protein Rep
MSLDFLTDDDEKNQEIVNDLEKGLYRKRMLSYGCLLKVLSKLPSSASSKFKILCFCLSKQP